MVSVSDGQGRILAQVITVAPPELIPVGRCLGRVTAEDVRSSMDVPPTDNSAVDGYAVGSRDIPAGGTRELDVVAELPAGAVFPDLLEPGQALRIMTGAPMPAGADTVYPQEIVTRESRRFRWRGMLLGPIPARWDFGPGNLSIVFYGSFCDQLQMGMIQNVHAIFGCPPVP